MIRASLTALLLTSALACRAGDAVPLAIRPVLGLPIDCRPGIDCWVANYFDVDASGLARDFRCGPRSYEGHDGVDIAIRDLGVMARGVAVRAAADGTVRNVRDGMEDSAVRDDADRARIAGRDCGNGIVIDHPGGWQTQYCHLRRGSVGVKRGQTVVRGEPIAQVGLSGLTEFPHLHVALRLGLMQIDPFSGLPTQEGCGAVAGSLWDGEAGLSYEDVALYNAGFAPGPPDIEAIRRGERTDGPLPLDAPALVLWVDMFGVREGDRVSFRINAPGGRLLHEGEHLVDRTQARRYAFSGARRTEAGWAEGVYSGQITIERSVEGKPRRSSMAVETRLGG